MRPPGVLRLCSPIAQQPMPCVSALTRYRDCERKAMETFVFWLDLLLVHAFSIRLWWRDN